MSIKVHRKRAAVNEQDIEDFKNIWNLPKLVFKWNGYPKLLMVLFRIHKTKAYSFAFFPLIEFFLDIS